MARKEEKMFFWILIGLIVLLLVAVEVYRFKKGKPQEFPASPITNATEMPASILSSFFPKKEKRIAWIKRQLEERPLTLEELWTLAQETKLFRSKSHLKGVLRGLRRSEKVEARPPAGAKKNFKFCLT
jgi:hypothetical protein